MTRPFIALYEDSVHEQNSIGQIFKNFLVFHTAIPMIKQVPQGKHPSGVVIWKLKCNPPEKPRKLLP